MLKNEQKPTPLLIAAINMADFLKKINKHLDNYVKINYKAGSPDSSFDSEQNAKEYCYLLAASFLSFITGREVSEQELSAIIERKLAEGDYYEIESCASRRLTFDIADIQGAFVLFGDHTAEMYLGKDGFSALQFYAEPLN